MKLFLIAALAAFTVLAQDAKKEVASKTTPQSKVEAPERPLSETEVLKLANAALKIKVIDDRYKMEDYRKEVQPIAAEQNLFAMSLCKSIGIPQDLIQTQCGIATGLDNDGKPLLDPAGKPVAARVWWVKPTPPATPASSGSGTK